MGSYFKLDLKKINSLKNSLRLHHKTEGGDKLDFEDSGEGGSGLTPPLHLLQWSQPHLHHSVTCAPQLVGKVPGLLCVIFTNRIMTL